MFEADDIIARRRLKRQVSLWRVVAVIAVAAGIAVAGMSGAGGFGRYGDHIARIKITGLISGNDKTLKLFKDLEEADQVKAVIVHIDSPGGTTAGAEAVYEAMRSLAETKPMVSVMGTVAASGAYVAAIATDHIVARGNTITGSVGVIFQWPQVSGLLDNIGVEVNEIKSGALKAEPNMFAPLPEKARAVNQAMVMDAHRWFAGLVKQRRAMSDDNMARVTDGRVFTGRQAQTEGLVDALGGEQTALDWLKDSRQINGELEIIDWRRNDSDLESGLGLRVLALALRAVGLEGVAVNLEKISLTKRVNLDGLLSVWQPSG